MVWLPGAETIFMALSVDLQWHWWEIFYYYYFHFMFVAVILGTGVYAGLNWTALCGKPVTREELIPGLKLTLLIYLFSIAAAYALFIPLSYVIPEFVQWWFLDEINVIYYDGNSYPVFANLLGFISLVILAPVIEEVAFRGILLHRWSRKWGVKKAIILSSTIFAVLHADPIGAFVFGVGMCILYLRTQSLWIPICCHAANNLVVWIIEVIYRITDGPDLEYTLEGLRNDWYFGTLCGLLVVLWVSSYLRNPTGLKEWRLPVV